MFSSSGRICVLSALALLCSYSVYADENDQKSEVAVQTGATNQGPAGELQLKWAPPMQGLRTDPVVTIYGSAGVTGKPAFFDDKAKPLTGTGSGGGVILYNPSKPVSAAAGAPKIFDISPTRVDFDVGGALGVLFMPSGVRVKNDGGESLVRAVPLGMLWERAQPIRYLYSGIDLGTRQTIYKGLSVAAHAKGGITYAGDGNNLTQAGAGLYGEIDAALRMTFGDHFALEAGGSASTSAAKITDTGGSKGAVGVLNPDSGDSSRMSLTPEFKAGVSAIVLF